ncbi:SDR family NAD(P)-dependent oxidoreductase [Actinocorallia sp. API 0066]|uniref:SDR family oxidoreductase n=1 Tax=Actinocorallia sp. API 0066 TaxID=2896846 RepID=UPI001E3A0B47|nr:SDR family NAD(P)-dependent oxidoreductase [Actinocorallia sp. API 0066]MCD0448962.1 SDR family NAD(P)-dependent oxidoreductase [Actinocorallia sp. API 0066]
MDPQGKVAWITGGANGIGAAVARRLAGLGAHVVVTDVDAEEGEKLAYELDGLFVSCDVRVPEENVKAVKAAVARFGGLDIAFLNAGVATGSGMGEHFDAERYRRAMAVNLDGVVYGVNAALPALRARGGGAIIATASMAGLTPMPLDPLYGANKTAVVGLVRSLGPTYLPEGIRVNALCPSFAETAILDGLRELLGDFPILDVETVADAFLHILASDEAGQAWPVVPGREFEPFRFRGVPGPRR